MKKYIPRLAEFGISLLIFIGGILVFPRFTDHINNGKKLVSVGRTLTSVQESALEFKSKHDRWPQLPELVRNNHSLSLNWYKKYWDFSVEEQLDTFVVTATLLSEYANLDEQYIGEFLSVDNFGNWTYSHEDFKKMDFKRFLRDAKKVENKKN